MVRVFSLITPGGAAKLAVIVRRAGIEEFQIASSIALKATGLLQRPKPRAAALHQAAKLFELLPQKVNDLWQADVTYIHIPGFGWWYAVTVIDLFQPVPFFDSPATTATALIEAINCLAQRPRESTARCRSRRSS